MTTVNPLKWAGGKQYLAAKIIGLMPPHLHYVEPYFGAGAVLFRKNPEGVSEVVNDLNGELTNFWKCLQSPTGLRYLHRKLSNTPFSEVEWEGAVGHKGKTPDDAVKFFIRYRQSRQGLGRDFATLSRTRTRAGMNEQVSSWLSAIDSLPEAHARLRRVVILNRDALDVIREQDGPDTLVYADPPYLHETRTDTTAFGDYEMSTEQHEYLIGTLARIKGKFILSGYPSKLYNKEARAAKWKCHKIKIDNKASSAKSKEIKTECLWCNF